METATLSTFVAESLRSKDGTGTQRAHRASEAPSPASRTRRNTLPDARTSHCLVPRNLRGNPQPAALPSRPTCPRRTPKPARRGAHLSRATRARLAIQAGTLFTRSPRAQHLRAHHRRHYGAADAPHLLLVGHTRAFRRRALHRRVRRMRDRPDHRGHRDLLVPLRPGRHRRRHRRRRPGRHDPRIDPRLRRLPSPRPHPAHACHAGDRDGGHGPDLDAPQSRHRHIADHAGTPGRHVPPPIPRHGLRPGARHLGCRLHGDLRVQQRRLRHPPRRPRPPCDRLVDVDPHHPRNDRGRHRLPRHHGRR